MNLRSCTSSNVFKESSPTILSCLEQHGSPTKHIRVTLVYVHIWGSKQQFHLAAAHMLAGNFTINSVFALSLYSSFLDDLGFPAVDSKSLKLWKMTALLIRSYPVSNVLALKTCYLYNKLCLSTIFRSVKNENVSCVPLFLKNCILCHQVYLSLICNQVYLSLKRFCDPTLY